MRVGATVRRSGLEETTKSLRIVPKWCVAVYLRLAGPDASQGVIPLAIIGGVPMELRSGLLLTAACCAGLACGRTPPSQGAAPHRQADTVLVTVINQNFYDANVYASYDGYEVRRLGLVTGFSTDTFALPWRGSLLRMHMRFVGAGGGSSNELLVDPGDVLEFIIQPDAHRRTGVQ